MKTLLLVLSVVSFSSAHAEYIDGLAPEACKITSRKSETVTCAAKNAAVVNRAKASGKNLTTADWKRLSQNGYKPVMTLDARDLGLMPDADTNYIYGYDRFLRDELGSIVGVLSIAGYTNSETEEKIQVTIWTNLLGQITRLSVK